MAARAMWKGVIRFEDVAVPVKLYSALQDRSVHFRLLHQSDGQPVKQVMIDPETDEIVSSQQIRRAYAVGEGELVLLTDDELQSLKPEPSRDIEIIGFLPAHTIDQHWYDRPYFLGPDGGAREYTALARVLEGSGREGLARWVMRNKQYFGALRVFQGYPMLVSLRYADQVVSAEALQAPGGKPLDKRELEMARQLIGMLEARFEPGEYRDEYRQRVMELIETKQQGGRIKRPARRRKQAPDEDITAALEASLKAVQHG